MGLGLGYLFLSLLSIAPGAAALLRARVLAMCRQQVHRPALAYMRLPQSVDAFARQARRPLGSGR